MQKIALRKNYLIQRWGSFSISSLSFPRRRESRNVFIFGSPPARGQGLDARLRGHDGKNSPTPQIDNVAFFYAEIVQFHFRGVK